MLRNTPTLVALCFSTLLACSITACSNQSDEKRTDNDTKMMDSSSRTMAKDSSMAGNSNTPMMTDEEFIKAAAVNGRDEIEAGKLAMQMGHAKTVKAYAQKMVNDHMMVSKMLKPLADAHQVTLPTQQDSAHQRMAKMLMNEKTSKFDRDYLIGQVKDHEVAVALFESEAKNGKAADVKKFAADHLEALRQHLSLARGLADSLGRMGM